MAYESKRKVQSIILWTIFYALQFQVRFIFARQLHNETGAPAQSPVPSPSSYYFLVEGDPLENGFIRATVQVGNGLKQFFLDIDTGSDLTWITCSPAKIKFLKPFSIYPTPNGPYVTNNNFVSCVDASICGFVEKPVNPQCSVQNQQCDYQVEYADHGTTLGVLVNDTFLFSSSLKGNPLQSTTSLTFGCGYHQEFSPSLHPPFADGVLGLGSGKTSILSQLSEQGLIKKVMALCSSDKFGPGYLVLGDSLSNSPDIMWSSLLNNHVEPNLLGPADLYYEDNLLASGLQFLLDSGTTYSYFSPEIYQPVLSQVKELAAKVGTPVMDPYLPVCWKPMTSSDDFLDSFWSMYLSFTSDDDVNFELAPFDYLTISPHDNVCLGILESQELGPAVENLNIIGDLPQQQRLVINDYENQKIGWNVVADCSNLPAQLSSTGSDMIPAKKRNGKSQKGKDLSRNGKNSAYSKPKRSFPIDISFVFKMKKPPEIWVKLINELADIEYRLTFACNDKLQLGTLPISRRLKERKPASPYIVYESQVVTSGVNVCIKARKPASPYSGKPEERSECRKTMSGKVFILNSVTEKV
ncbi:unnamed protein product [Fraxinus pennsylvanica]|uniref:Peptidase A1 domain-containing protein n=1 Tax=Fraxinus pennsylvanica TaxID=56036 RepID=A0AAD2A339_9LAMI|nr:unnamed protein product [Fraxinus pennsylvanica]